ncbi:hypothetical protein F511_07691 [Dorcoceras hygrometricum]|uniref:Uncharacterized protein n=1 Tax=Dorcoceras hygrometricum TaxID=472368 RepID=A0A2Z7CK08_9LAMI|nr:hypothetical protein F511_07691 [Dorcoceras hygrometricum]
MGAGKGYNSAVECHLDVVEVISSSLIIPKPNSKGGNLLASFSELEESNPPAQSEEELWHAASLASPVRPSLFQKAPLEG